MNHIDLVVKEYEASVKAFLQAKENKQKTIRLSLGIISAIVAVTVRGILPIETHALTAFLFVIFFSYLSYLAHKQSCASGAAQISERKLSAAVETEYSNSTIFDLNQRTKYLRDGLGKVDKLGRFVRAILNITYVIWVFGLAHLGFSGMQLTTLEYFGGMFTLAIFVILVAVIGYIQNQKRKERFAKLLDNEFRVPND